jgi:hypothetical protein
MSDSAFLDVILSVYSQLSIRVTKRCLQYVHDLVLTQPSRFHCPAESLRLSSPIAPMATSPVTACVIVAAVAGLGLYFLFRRGAGQLPLPPGPKGTMLIGNLFDWPTDGKDWVTFSKWREQYGMIMNFDVERSC